jgi:AcrR family transcriptional regulator
VNRPRRGRPPIVDLRHRILRAAEAVFIRREYDRVRMEDVARACGVAKGTLYLHFPGKRELYLALLFDAIGHVHEILETELASAGPAAEKIERIVRFLLSYFWNRRYFLALIQRVEHLTEEPAAREWLRRRSALAKLVERAIADGVARGELRDVDPRIAAEMLLGMIRGVNRYRVGADALGPLVAAVVSTFLEGAEPRAQAEAGQP